MSSPTFTGTSKYSSDLQQIIARTVSIASLPLQQLTNQQNLLNSQSTELTTIGQKFSDLQTALDNLQTAVTQGSLTGSSSDSSVAGVVTGAGAVPATYTINVTSLGSAASALSPGGSTVVADPASSSITSSNQLTLTVGGTPYTINPSGNNLLALVNAINISGADVQATVVNLGSAAAPDYRLSVQSTKLASNTIQLNDGSSDLLQQLSAGSPATYQIDGQPTTPISSDTRSLNIAPGVTVNLQGTGSTDVTVSQTTSSIKNALTAFATSYNAAVDELAQNRGKNGGALAGDSIVQTLSSTLHSLTNYSSGGSGISGLTQLGLQFDKNGHLQLDSTTFDSATTSNSGALLQFLGDESSSGFLQSADLVLKSLDDPTTGLIPGKQQLIANQISNQNNLIADEQARVDATQASITAQIAQSDALISSLESQQTFFTGLFQDQFTPKTS